MYNFCDSLYSYLIVQFLKYYKHKYNKLKKNKWFKIIIILFFNLFKTVKTLWPT